MPLVICAIFFIILFTCEGLYFLGQRDRRADELRRYQDVEHPRRATSDRYLDLLG